MTSTTTAAIHPALRSLADRLAAEQPGVTAADALVRHVATLARRHVAATGCTFRDACDLVVDLLLAEHGHRQDEKPPLHTTRPAWADRADATGTVVWTPEHGWADQ